VLHKLETMIHKSFIYTSYYILLKLQRRKAKYFVPHIFHFFCIIMLNNCMIIDTKIKHFDIIKSTAKFSNLEFSLVFHFSSIGYLFSTSLPCPSSLPFTGSSPSFLLKFFSSPFIAASDARISSHSSSQIKHWQFRASFCNCINGEIINNNGI